jgi:NADH-quinone oxidoreductase subunit I
MPALKGVGLIKGLGVTLRTMTRPAATRQYPHVKPDLPARTRGVIALIEENCTVCMLCSRECPDWCIYIDSHKEQVAPKEGGRARTRNVLDRFAIDFALCMYCGICVEVCPFDALHWSPEFEYAEHRIENLTHEMDTLRRWAYTVPAPDPLEEGAVEPKELEAARKAREAIAAKAAAAAEQARAAAAPAPAAPAATRPAPAPAPAAPAPAPAAPTPAPAAARAPDVEVEPGIDQETYDRLLAAGEPDRTARAKAKAAYMRKAKAEARAAQAAATVPAPAETAGEAPAGQVEPPAAEPGSVETPAAAGSAPETAPPAPSAAGTTEAAEPAADARDPEARSPEVGQTAAGTAVDVAPGAATAQADAEHLEVEVDQETYDRLIAAGEPERTARAKAKAAYARKLRAAQRGGGSGS